MEKYNGWSNYETWRIALEVFDGYEIPSDVETLMDAYSHLHDIVEDVVLGSAECGTLAYDLLVSFLANVNYYEIAQNLSPKFNNQ